jgi:hypothetical protein
VGWRREVDRHSFGSLASGNCVGCEKLRIHSTGQVIMISHRWAWVRCSLAAALSLSIVVAGCNVLGFVGTLAPPPTIAAAYKGLAKQKVGVMVWTDRAMAIDWPTLQLDLARGINSRLEDETKKKSPAKELEGTSFAMPESVIRFQRDHPEAEAQSITDVAPRMDLTRLIYIEVEQFSTRPEESLELYRGSITANLKVIEIADGKGKIAFQKDKIRILYPEKGNAEGVPNLSDLSVYEKTVTAFSGEIVNQFVSYTAPEK